MEMQLLMSEVRVSSPLLPKLLPSAQVLELVLTLHGQLWLQERDDALACAGESCPMHPLCFGSGQFRGS